MYKTSIAIIAIAAIIVASPTARLQTFTFTINELESVAPLSWQSHSDPAGRLTIGDDDGNASASPHATSYASVIRWGGAHNQPGLLDEFTVSADETPAVFGLGRSDCAVTDAASFDACIPVRWQPSAFFGPSVMEAHVKLSNQTATFLEHDVKPGDVFSIERVEPNTIRFYRSTDVPDERQRIGTFTSPFTSDDGPLVSVRAVFPPDPVVREVSSASERYYYCCP